MKMNYFDDSNIRSIDRSPYRNMPSSCVHCGYMNRPSFSGLNYCSASCCMKLKQDYNREK